VKPDFPFIVSLDQIKIDLVLAEGAGLDGGELDAVAFFHGRARSVVW
jgi:hypothetical protein